MLAVVGVDVRAADAHGLDLQQGLVGLALGHRNLMDFKGFRAYQGDLLHVHKNPSFCCGGGFFFAFLGLL